MKIFLLKEPATFCFDHKKKFLQKPSKFLSVKKCVPHRSSQSHPPAHREHGFLQHQANWNFDPQHSLISLLAADHTEERYLNREILIEHSQGVLYSVEFRHNETLGGEKNSGPFHISNRTCRHKKRQVLES